MHIDTALLPMKAHYFLYNAGTAPVWPFMPTLAKQLGFSSVVVGTIYTILPILGMLVKPSMGILADMFRIKKSLFIASIVVTILAFVGIPWIPRLPLDIESEIHCDTAVEVKICPKEMHDSCYVSKIQAEGQRIPLIDCEMNCKGDADFLKEVCTAWHEQQFCAAPHRLPNNHLLNVAKKQAGIEGKEYVTEKSLPIVSTSQILDFRAKLRQGHIYQVKNCFYISMGNVSFHQNDNWHPVYCNSFKSADCNMKCQSALLTEAATDSKVDDSDVIFIYQFWLLFVMLIFCYVGMASTVSLGDAICFEILGDRPTDYGYQRLWGSVGWGLFSIMSGFLLDKFSEGSATKDYKPAIYMLLVVLVLDILISSRLKFTQKKHSPRIVRDFGKLITEARILVFALWCICVGIVQAVSWNFLFWYLEDLATQNGCEYHDWIKTLEGLVMGIQCFIGELPCFFFSGWILKKIGHTTAMSLVLISNGCRFLLYASLSNPWWVLPIEFINGFTFGMFYSTMASYASIVAPPGAQGTVQGLAGALFEGVGVSLGSCMAGLFLKVMSGSGMFCVFGSAILVCSLLHILAQYFIAKRSSSVILHEGDLNRARYASPNDAMDMLEDDQQDLTLS